MRTIVINPALNGYTLQVGCQTVVFDSKKDMLRELSDYLDNPEMTERRYLKNAINKMPETVETTLNWSNNLQL